MACKWMMAGLSSLPWPESDWLDSGAWWGCTPVVHWAISVHRLNQPSPHTHSERSATWQHEAPLTCNNILDLYSAFLGLQRIIVCKPDNNPSFKITSLLWSWRSPEEPGERISTRVHLDKVKLLQQHWWNISERLSLAPQEATQIIIMKFIDWFFCCHISLTFN